MWCTGNGTVGSNPTLSATMSTLAWLQLLLDVAIIGYCFYFNRSVVLLYRRVPYVPTRRAVAEEVAVLIGELPEGAVLYDLGCGDARVLVKVAKRNPKARLIGIEMQRIPYFLARLRTAGTGIQIIRADMFTQDLSSATHVYAYLYDHVMDALLPKLEKEQQPGTKLYALDFQFKDRMPEAEYPLASRRKGRLGEVLRVYRF